MIRFALVFLTALICLILPASAMAQQPDTTDEVISRFLIHFEQSSDKLLQLAHEIPEELYSWSPDGEAMSVATAFAHIARYNFTIPSQWLGIDIPPDVNTSTMEEITDKQEIIAILTRSIEHINEEIPGLNNSDLQKTVTIFGDETRGWAALFLLISHMNEHVGQLVAYARINNITPPWSR